MADRDTSTAAAHLELVLEQIATAANLLARFANTTAAADEDEGPDRETALHVVSAMAERIGMLADAACGERIVGNPMAWACGPNYQGADHG